MKLSKIYVLVLFLSLTLSSCNHKGLIVVRNMKEFNQAVRNSTPGDVITLANGIWTDAELLFAAEGTSDKPIVLKAEEKGKVFLEGESDLRIAGNYLTVEGLVFKNGHTPTTEVISFKKEDGVYANHCRLTECVIDNFNNSERFETEAWVALYGKNNRVDHCYFTGKRDQGLTLTVRLIDTLCQNNNHLIDHNYFGYRQNLGSNGGETIRIGTSHYSLSTSGTIVKENYFEHCDGELEIISNKSCGNKYINNTLFECWGTLTFRHGNDNIAEGNFFLGNGKKHTGGIRIINKRNKAINNYLYGLTGYRFRGALVIMNGVPNSPINRYFQVIGGDVEDNTFINCDHIQLCAGRDKERTLPPIDTKISKNIFYNENSSDIFTIYDDISGITFSDNYISSNMKSLGIKGITPIDIKLKKDSLNIYIPVNKELEGIGCSIKKPIATAKNTGVDWYPIKNEELEFGTGNKIEVKAGLNTLYGAIKTSKSGDIIVLKDSGYYKLDKIIKVDHPLTIMSVDPKITPILETAKTRMFEIENEGSLKLLNLEFNGRFAQDKPGNCIISTSSYSMNRNYKLIIENCKVKNLDVNHSFDFIKVYKNTFVDSLVIRNCSFENVTGNIAALDKETEELGIYNVEDVIIENSSFKNINGYVLSILRGGNDESTFGPDLSIDHCVFDNVGNGKRNESNAALYVHGVQITRITNSIFVDSKAIKLQLTNGEPITAINYCDFYNSEGIVSNKDSYSAQNNFKLKPDFVKGSYELEKDSKLKGLANNNTDLGLIRNK